MSRIFGCCLLAALVGLAGCSSPYVNIPSQRGDVASHSPNAKNVRAVEVAALRAVLLDDPIPGPILIKLPEGSNELHYAAVVSQVAEDAVAPYDKDVDPVSTLEVRQIRLRGWEGEVDVVRPGVGERSQLTTVSVKYAPMSGWTAERLRNWRGIAEVTLPGPEMEPAPVEQP